MTPEQRAEIKARVERHRFTPETRAKLVSEHYADLAQILGDDVPALLDEVERLTARVAALAEDAELLSALQTAGVDNWSGYEYAHEILSEWQGGEPA